MWFKSRKREDVKNDIQELNELLDRLELVTANLRSETARSITAAKTLSNAIGRAEESYRRLRQLTR